VTVDLFQEELMDGDILLLCSDGLWEMVRDRKWMVEAITSAENLTAACTRLVEAANQAGGDDNISVILARYHA
jgi:serine/threonine protein phosphatase PrpC